MPSEFYVDPDPARAHTLPAAFYRSSEVFQALRERVFARSWQWVGHDRDLAVREGAHPFTLLSGHLDEPLVLTQQEDGAVSCLSNVCTHRGNLVVQQRGPCTTLRCRYHGRRFERSGRFRSMPEFDGVEGFPSAEDDLPSVQTATLGGHRFVSLDPSHSFDALTSPVRERIGGLPMQDFRLDPTRSTEYLVHAHWALYVDNYLEGFHIPYVHPALAGVVDYDSYRDLLFPWASLQLARARGAEPAFEAPLSAHDEGQAAAAYYYWLFPNTMLNFYPWGLSVNVVQPLALDRTKVSFYSYVNRPDLLDQGAGGALDAVQREDEQVVESVQQGIGSRLYRRGRFSVRREGAVHLFHRLLSEAVGGSVRR